MRVSTQRIGDKTSCEAKQRKKIQVPSTVITTEDPSYF